MIVSALTGAPHLRLPFYRAVPSYNPRTLVNMTDLTAGIKRGYEGDDSSSRKKARDREQPKDWRDVHLDSPRRPSKRSHSRGDKDPRRPNNRDRGNDRDRDNKRHHGSNDHRRDRHHHSPRPSSKPRNGDSRSGRKSPRPVVHPDSEREEGEYVNIYRVVSCPLLTTLFQDLPSLQLTSVSVGNSKTHNFACVRASTISPARFSTSRVRVGSSCRVC